MSRRHRSSQSAYPDDPPVPIVPLETASSSFYQYPPLAVVAQPTIPFQAPAAGLVVSYVPNNLSEAHTDLKNQLSAIQYHLTRCTLTEPLLKLQQTVIKDLEKIYMLIYRLVCAYETAIEALRSAAGDNPLPNNAKARELLQPARTALNIAQESLAGLATTLSEDASALREAANQPVSQRFVPFRNIALWMAYLEIPKWLLLGGSVIQMAATVKATRNFDKILDNDREIVSSTTFIALTGNILASVGSLGDLGGE
ncbi:hypothetical protein FRC17_001651 [Serendipita sp. 399]|nr:hypothetical protein FRC17_001651 [Serendipita sp. 399]